MKEKEVKIAIQDTQMLEQVLSDTEPAECIFTRDIYYDRNSDELKKSDIVIRLRLYDKKYYFAYKTPRIIIDNIITREEIELEVENENKVDMILTYLHYYKRDIVEKKRKQLKNSLFPSLTLVLDQYPFIGNYVEAEGEEDDINQYLEYYRIDRKYLQTLNCTELFLQYCDMNNIKTENNRLVFTFNDEKKYGINNYKDVEHESTKTY